MKFLALGVLLLAVACGKSEVGALAEGQFSGTIQAVTADTLNTLASVCQVLRDKEPVLRSNYLGNGAKFNFTTTQVACNGTTQTSNVVTRLGYSSGSLVYELISGSFFLSQVETGTAGTMSALCNNLATLTQPLVLNNDVAVRFSILVGSSCSSDGNHRCVQMDTGFKQSGASYAVKYTDIYRVDLNAGPLSGMVVRHEHKSFDGCSEGKAVTNVATFVGVSF